MRAIEVSLWMISAVDRRPTPLPHVTLIKFRRRIDRPDSDSGARRDPRVASRRQPDIANASMNMITGLSVKQGVFESSGRSPLGDDRLRLAFDRVFWRLALGVFVFSEFQTWAFTLRVAPWAPLSRRIWYVLFQSPKLFYFALLIAAAATVAIDLTLRFVVDRLVRYWSNPRGVDPETAVFRLGLAERERDHVPARRLSDNRRWDAGLLVLTDRGVWFLPRDWDRDSFSTSFARLRSAAIVPGPKPARGLILGSPRRLILTTDSDERETFVVGDPTRAAAWFHST
jgi:hypothetical protein